MAKPAELEKLTGLASRFGAFVAETHPFALSDALEAFEKAVVEPALAKASVFVRNGTKPPRSLAELKEATFGTTAESAGHQYLVRGGWTIRMNVSMTSLPATSASAAAPRPTISPWAASAVATLRARAAAITLATATV